MVYKWYILPIGGLYATYHLLGEPETTIDDFGWKFTQPLKLRFLHLKRWNLLVVPSLFSGANCSFSGRVAVLPGSPLGIFDPFILCTSNLWYDGVIQAKVILTTKPVTKKLQSQSRKPIRCNKHKLATVISKQYLLLNISFMVPQHFHPKTHLGPEQNAK